MGSARAPPPLGRAGGSGGLSQALSDSLDLDAAPTTTVMEAWMLVLPSCSHLSLEANIWLLQFKCAHWRALLSGSGSDTVVFAA